MEYVLRNHLENTAVQFSDQNGDGDIVHEDIATPPEQQVKLSIDITIKPLVCRKKDRPIILIIKFRQLSTQVSK